MPGSGQYETFEKQKDHTPWYITIGAIALPVVITCSYFLYKYIRERKWTTGKFPAELPATNENLLEAYMSLTAQFILFDRYRQMEKIAFLKSYFMRYYGSTPVDIHDSIQRNFHYPIALESTAEWVNKHYTAETKRHMLQFLVGLCHIDKILKQREYEGLKRVTATLEIELAFLDATIHTYREQKSGPKRGEPLKMRQSEKQKCAAILGVPEKAGEQEIKRRYRELAKLYHPDRYSKDSAEQQKMAHDRFLEIQRAYEFLLSRA